MSLNAEAAFSSYPLFTNKFYTMKKLFALVFAIGAVTSVFAQRSYDRRDESRDVILGQQNHSVYNNNRGNDGYFSTRERDDQIERINRNYNWRIQSVRNDRHLRNAEKKREIRFLENERDSKIREVVERYNYYNNNNRNYRTRKY
jgi:hypothetical protein